MNYIDKYNNTCVRILSSGKTIPLIFPHKLILKEELYIPNGYEEVNDPPQYRIITLDEKTATPFLVLSEVQQCEYVGYFESIESAHIFGESRSTERFFSINKEKT